jgi:hypothetical protein
MTTSAKSVRFDEFTMWVELNDGRTLGVPLAWFPRLVAATPTQLASYDLSARGIHWDELDEDLSIDGLLANSQGEPHRRAA